MKITVAYDVRTARDYRPRPSESSSNAVLIKHFSHIVRRRRRPRREEQTLRRVPRAVVADRRFMRARARARRPAYCVLLFHMTALCTGLRNGGGGIDVTSQQSTTVITPVCCCCRCRCYITHLTSATEGIENRIPIVIIVYYYCCLRRLL